MGLPSVKIAWGRRAQRAYVEEEGVGSKRAVLNWHEANPREYARIMEIVHSLRFDLGLRPNTPALSKIEGWILTSWAEGYQVG